MNAYEYSNSAMAYRSFPKDAEFSIVKDSPNYLAS